MNSILQILAGLILLFVGGESLIKGAVAIAKKLGLSTFMIGLTIVAYGTSSPELIISAKAAIGGFPDIALGNVIGSNISNIFCVVGLTALIYPIAVDKNESGFDLKIMLISTMMIGAACLFGFINYIAAVIFLVFLTVYTIYIFKKQRTITVEVTDIEEESSSLPLAIVFLIAGILLLMFGADLLVKGAVVLAKTAGISEGVIGVTLVALGGSMPELVTSVVAAWRKKSDIVLGNVIGSNLFNVLGIIGITGIIEPITVDSKFIEVDIPVLFIASVALVFLVFNFKSITRLHGLLLFAGYALYIAMQFI